MSFLDPKHTTATDPDSTDATSYPFCPEGDAATMAQLLASAAREFREPVDRILTSAARTRGPNLSNEQQLQLDEIDASAAALFTVVNDLHDLAAIQINQFEPERLSFSIRQVLADAIRTVAPQADAKGIRLVGDVPGDLDDMVAGDPGRLRAVTSRVLRQVVDATDRTHVHVRVTKVRDAGNAVMLRFDVEDTSPDADPSSGPPPVRAYARTDHDLGTLVVIDLVAALGGLLVVDDIPNQVGVHFMIEFDVPEVSEPTSSTSPDATSAARPVLIVSDSLNDRRALLSALAAAGMVPVAVAYPYTSDAGMNFADGNGTTPQAAVIQVADDPFAVCEEFLSRTRHQIPVTMVVPAGHRGDAARCRDLGVAGYLTLPIADGDLVDAVKATARPAEGVGTPELVTRHWLREGRTSLQILVADDSAVNRRLTSNVLERRGHAVTTVADGAEAVEAVRNGSFDVVVMDVQMPGINGLEATALIRSGERETHIPIVALTAFVEQADRERCFAAGMDGHLAKPWRPEELAVVVENAAVAATPEVNPCYSQSRDWLTAHGCS